MVSVQRVLGMPYATNKRRPRTGAAYLAIYSVFLIVLLISMELALRLMGIGPWHVDQPYLTMEPAGRYFVPDETLGYKLRSGRSMLLSDVLTRFI